MQSKLTTVSSVFKKATVYHKSLPTCSDRRKNRHCFIVWHRWNKRKRDIFFPFQINPSYRPEILLSLSNSTKPVCFFFCACFPPVTKATPCWKPQVTQHDMSQTDSGIVFPVWWSGTPWRQTTGAVPRIMTYGRLLLRERHMSAHFCKIRKSTRKDSTLL